jgi:hypothetical protein
MEGRCTVPQFRGRVSAPLCLRFAGGYLLLLSLHRLTHDGVNLFHIRNPEELECRHPAKRGTLDRTSRTSTKADPEGDRAAAVLAFLFKPLSEDESIDCTERRSTPDTMIAPRSVTP